MQFGFVTEQNASVIAIIIALISSLLVVSLLFKYFVPWSGLKHAKPKKILLNNIDDDNNIINNVDLDSSFSSANPNTSSLDTHKQPGAQNEASAFSANTGDGQTVPELTEVIIAFTMHYDIGYTDLAEGVLFDYRTKMVDEAVKSVNATSHLPVEKQFIWMVPGWPMKYITENANPERIASMEKVLKSKRIVLGATAFTSETDSSDLENVTRSLGYSSTLNRRFGLPLPRDAKMSDVPEHSWILPTVLRHAGVDILHLGCNTGSASPVVPYLFWWIGPDGSRLLTFYWPLYYGSGLMPPDDWPYKTWLAMISTNENTGPPTPEDVEKILKEAKEKLPGVKVRLGRLSDFYDAIIKEKAVIPEIRGDMPDTWIHGYMSMPYQVKIQKRYQRSLYETEALHAQQEIWGLKPEIIRQDVDRATESMLLFEEHTFGLPITSGAGSNFAYDEEFITNQAMENYDRLEISWREKAAHSFKTQKIGAMLQNRMISALAASVKVEGKKLIVYNSLPWVRSESVKLFLNITKIFKLVTGLIDTRDHKIIPVYCHDNLLQFHAEKVPAMGYTTYIPIFEKNNNYIIKKSTLILHEPEYTIGNDLVQISFDKFKGTIISFIDKVSGKELVDKSNKYGMGEYFHEYFGRAELERYFKAYVKPQSHDWADGDMTRPVKNFNLTYEEIRPSMGRWSFQKNFDHVSATYFGELPLHSPQKYTVTYIVKAHSPRIELVWAVQNITPEGNPEGGWIALPFNFANPKFHLSRVGGIVDPAKDLVPKTNHDYFFLNTGLAVTDAGGFGAGVNSPDAPCVSLERPGLFRFSETFVPTISTIFVNLYNNQWGTNFTEWINDGWSAKIYLWPIQKYDNESGLISPIQESRQPMQGYYIDGPAGRLPAVAQGVSTSSKGIIVTSFMQMPDTNKYRLRLWELAGNTGDCIVSLPIGQFHFAFASLINLRDEPLPAEKIPIVNNKFNINIKAHQPVSLLLE